jgi:hypothetical protein
VPLITVASAILAANEALAAGGDVGDASIAAARDVFCQDLAESLANSVADGIEGMILSGKTIGEAQEGHFNERFKDLTPEERDDLRKDREAPNPE